MKTLTQDDLRMLVSYDQNTGAFTWLERAKNGLHCESHLAAWNKRFAGKVAGTINSHGYVVIDILGKKYRAHRLAFLFINGSFPSQEVDHINEITWDNRWSNLRCATLSQNKFNRGSPKNSVLGVKGVCKSMGGKRFYARIKVNGKRMELGSFERIEDAATAYKEAAIKYHEDFAHKSVLGRSA